MTSTLIICGTVVLVVFLILLAAILAGQAGKARTPCYFAGRHVELGAPGGRRIGAQRCTGAAEFVYVASLTELNGSQVCAAHIGAMHELNAAEITKGYWLVTDS